jgi:AcrR family transcriptional regulator
MSFDAICQTMSNRKAPVESLPHHEMFTSHEARSGREREHIRDIGERLVRHFGHRKTTVADIASDLRTSRANIYRFFPTKDAIDQHVCGRAIGQTLDALRLVAAEQEGATARLQRVVEHLHDQNTRRATEEPHVHELFLAAHGAELGCGTSIF